MENVIIPYATTDQIRELVSNIYPDEKISLDSLCSRHQKSKSAYLNVIPTAQLLGLVEYKDGIIYLTKKGIDFGRANAKNNLKRMREIIRENIENNEVFQYVLDLLNAKKVLRNDEIGERLASKFNRNWSHPQTFARYGSCVAEILAFAGYGVYSDGILSTKEEVRHVEELPLPTTGVDKIKKILKRLVGSGKNAEQLAREFGGGRDRICWELSTIERLGLIQKSGNGFVLTERGREFINPLYSEEKRREIFRKCLLESPYANIIIRFIEKEELKIRELGEILAYELQKDWNESTKISYAKKFMNWLRYANIVTRGNKRGEYILNKESLELLQFKKDEFEQKKVNELTEPTRVHNSYVELSAPLYYKLGKLVERIKTKLKENEDINDEISKLIAICESVVNLRSFSSTIKSHYDLYMELRDARVLLPDLDLLDSFLGGE